MLLLLLLLSCDSFTFVYFTYNTLFHFFLFSVCDIYTHTAMGTGRACCRRRGLGENPRASFCYIFVSVIHYTLTHTHSYINIHRKAIRADTRLFLHLLFFIRPMPNVSFYFFVIVSNVFVCVCVCVCAMCMYVASLYIYV